MANELQFNDASLTGSTLYVVVWDAAGDAWNGSAFATYTTTRDTWDIAATEIGVTGKFTAPMPSGAYAWEWLLQAGGSPSHANDVSLKIGSIDRANDYSGNALATLAEQAKIPKSDGTVAPNATAIAAMQSGLALAATALSTAQWTSARAGYLDNANAGGVLATQADVNALNQSASRRIILTTIQQYERPESSSTDFWVEARLYTADGVLVNADSTPTLTATGNVTGSLAANLGAASNPSTGLYRWVYNVESTDALEQIRFDLSAVIAGDTQTLGAFAQVCDFVAATFTTNDRFLLEGTATGVDLAELNQSTQEALDLVQAKTDQLDFTGAGGALKSESTNMRGTDGANTTTPPTADQNATTLLAKATAAGMTVDQCLQAAWGQGFGKWTLVGTTLTLFAADGTTPLRTFTLNSASTPTSRTPV